MELRFSAGETAFRDEVRAFLKRALPEHIRAAMLQRRHLGRDDLVAWQRILNKQGWAVPFWPREWGGTGWTPVQRYIYLLELQRAPAPEPLSFNVGMIGPVLIAFGSEAQKKRFLPRLANLDDWWCQGFSEPGAGSDLAALRTSARREGDGYVVNGQKMWTTLGHHADWMFCLVRTDAAAKKQKGISMLLIDMRSPGITVRPVVTIDNAHETNEVFFDAVRVPVENLVGDENAGWTYAKFLLGNERSGIARVGITSERLAHARVLATSVMADGAPLIEQPAFRDRLTMLEIELKALEMTQMRLIASAPRGDGMVDPATSILKLKGSELQQAAIDLLLDVAGPLALPDLEGLPDDARPDSVPDWAVPLAPAWLYARVYSIYGGSNEIQKNIIAKAILGL